MFMAKTFDANSYSRFVNNKQEQKHGQEINHKKSKRVFFTYLYLARQNIGKYNL